MKQPTSEEWAMLEQIGARHQWHAQPDSCSAHDGWTYRAYGEATWTVKRHATGLYSMTRQDAARMHSVSDLPLRGIMRAFIGLCQADAALTDALTGGGR